MIFTGDTILGRGTTVVAYPDGDLGDYLDSLRRLALLGPVPVLPGHGPELGSCVAAASFYLEHRLARLAQVRDGPRGRCGHRRRGGRAGVRRRRPRSLAGGGAVRAGAIGLSRTPRTRRPARRPRRRSGRRPGRGTAGGTVGRRLGGCVAGIPTATWTVGPAVTCPVCGTVTVPGARFCHNCGGALPAAAGCAAAERRVVTVLFGDLSDFTAWAESVDPERVGAVTDRVLAALAGAVKTFGGTRRQAHRRRDHGGVRRAGRPRGRPERAVRAALAMLRAVRRVLDDERGGGVPAGLRIGVEHRRGGRRRSGVAGVHRHRRHGQHGRPAGRRGHGRRGLRGRRYRRGDPTRRLVATAAAVAAQGKAPGRRGVRAARPAGRARAPGQAWATRGRSSAARPRWPWSRAGWSRRSTGPSHGCWCSPADAGLGKTRIAAEVARLAGGFDRGTGGPARVLSVRCAAYGERWRLGPLADLVRVAIGLPETPGVTRATVEERLRRVGQLVERPRRTATRGCAPSSCSRCSDTPTRR